MQKKNFSSFRCLRIFTRGCGFEPSGLSLTCLEPLLLNSLLKDYSVKFFEKFYSPFLTEALTIGQHALIQVD